MKGTNISSNMKAEVIASNPGAFVVTLARDGRLIAICATEAEVAEVVDEVRQKWGHACDVAQV